MSSPFFQPTPTKPTTYPHGDVSSSPAKSNPNPPSKSRQSPINSGLGTSHNNVKVIAERRKARQEMISARPLARFDSTSQESKANLDGMAGMFSPEKDEQISPFEFPVKQKRGMTRRRHEGKGLILTGSGGQLSPL